MVKRRRTPWQKIRDAAQRGTGTRLSFDDVLRLSQDGAIITRAEMDDVACLDCGNDMDLGVCPECGNSVE